MPKIKLTDAAVQRFKAAPGERIDYFDVTLPGFGLRVSGPTPRNPEGRKSWVLFYRFAGEQKRLTIEPSYPALGLRVARRRAGAALQKLSAGADPAADKAERAKPAPRPDTIERVIDEFMHRHMAGKDRAPNYQAGTRRNFDNHVLPRWRGREIRSITRRDVIELLDAVIDEGKPVAANRVRAALSKLFNWSVHRGIIDVSPVALVERPGAEKKRERALAPEEIRAVWNAVGSLGYPFGPFLRLTFATAQRREEIAHMRWADIDEAERTWTLSSEQTKANRAHVVPLSPLAIDVLAGCPRLGTYVFTSRGDRPISGYSRAKRRVDQAIAKSRAPLDGWTIHDLRRTAATGMGRLGISRFAISRVLNHADGSVTGIYDRHEYLSEKRQALDAWGEYLGSLASGRHPSGASRSRPAITESAPLAYLDRQGG